jgi:hypothetical protein
MMRYGLLNRTAPLRDTFWQMTNPTVMATLNLAVLAAAAAPTAISIRVFTRAAVR